MEAKKRRNDWNLIGILKNFKEFFNFKENLSFESFFEVSFSWFTMNSDSDNSSIFFFFNHGPD